MSPTPSEPVAPPPVRKPTRPADRKPEPQQQSAALVPSEPRQEPLLATMLNGGGTSTERGADDGLPRTAYGAFMGLRRNVDPDKDLAPTAPRLPRYVIAAITLIRNATGRSQQQIIAEALTGKMPLSTEALDAAFLEIYGYPREDHTPQ